ncbi:MAG: PhzF family phenazine biosynthesis protein [Anaerolineae bacterium]|nr:PhzF family phenazine biosynthesis protein [Anaerolineae bacterium]
MFHYQWVDVFTDRLFGGNQLAVFTDAVGVSTETMQLIARKLNLSETTFVLPPEAPGADFRVRIFTPGTEMPFAGHPTIGTAYVLQRSGRIQDQVVFEEGVGLIHVRLEPDGMVWMTQPLPQFGEIFSDRQVIADLLSIPPDALIAELPVQVVSSGVPFLYVPVHDLATMRQIKVRADLWETWLKDWAASDIFVFTPEVKHSDSTVHSRMFGPSLGIVEDAATGGASGPLGAYLFRYGLAAGHNGRCFIISEQGIEMGRPSRIAIALEVDGTSIKSVQVGGYSRFVGEGTIQI